MRERGVIYVLLAVLFSVAFAFVSSPASAAVCSNSCNGNVISSSDVCAATDLAPSDCCPGTLPDYGLAGCPTNQIDCIANYYTEDDILPARCTTIGCCAGLFSGAGECTPVGSQADCYAGDQWVGPLDSIHPSCESYTANCTQGCCCYTQGDGVTIENRSLEDATQAYCKDILSSSVWTSSLPPNQDCQTYCTTQNANTCQDNGVQAGEQCDGADLNGNTCTSLGFANGGTLSCRNCAYDTSSCIPSAGNCNGPANGIVESEEGCDPLGPAFRPGLNGCESYGYAGGTLGCTSSCNLNFTQCIQRIQCDVNGFTSPYEECDPLASPSVLCNTLGRGYTSGIAPCSQNTCTFDVSSCSGTQPPPTNLCPTFSSQSSCAANNCNWCGDSSGPRCVSNCQTDCGLDTPNPSTHICTSECSDGVPPDYTPGTPNCCYSAEDNDATSNACCDPTQRNSLAITLFAGCTTGNKKVNLIWSGLPNGCNPAHDFLYINLTRSNAETTVTRTIDFSQTAYTDDTVAWDTSYVYQLAIMFLNGDIVESNVVSADTGNQICEGKSSTDKFCLSASNTQTGTLVRSGTCSSTSSSTGDTANCNSITTTPCGSEEQCYGEGKCRTAGECSDLGAPFGLYYSNETCLGTFNRALGLYSNSCAYDYSLTTVDACYSCDTINSCFDYRSKNACENNDKTCAVQSGADCQWVDTNPSFGKGICVSPVQETGVSKCGLCNDLFQNCTASQCSMLGECYYTSGVCSSCTDKPADFSCSSYTTQQGCTGSSTATGVTWSNATCHEPPTNKSSDACGLKTCRWDSGVCIKDADIDSIEDCGSSSSDCASDSTPPETIIENAPDLSTIYTKATLPEVTFTTPAEGPDSSSTAKYCLVCNDRTSSNYQNLPSQCCSYRSPTGTTLHLGRESSLNDKEALCRLFYYSRDSNHNVETPKHTDFRIDTKPVKIKVDAQQFGADLRINISSLSGEVMQCSNDTLTGAPSYQRLPSSYAPFFVTWATNIPIGTHTYNVTCEDRGGNKDSNTSLIIISRGSITSVDPTGKTYKPNTELTLRVTSSEPAQSCSVAGSSLWNNLVLDRDVSGLVFTKNVRVPSGQADGQYYPLANCTYPDGDTAEYSFSLAVDSTKPTLGLVWDQTQTPFDATFGYKQGGFTQDLSITCNDPPVGNANYLPNSFGCNTSSLKYCIGLNDVQCVTNIQDTTIPADTLNTIQESDHPILCYGGSDNGNNRALNSCVSFKVGQAPQVTFFIINQTNDTVSVVGNESYTLYLVSDIDLKTIPSSSAPRLNYTFTISSGQNTTIPVILTLNTTGIPTVWKGTIDASVAPHAEVDTIARMNFFAVSVLDNILAELQNPTFHLNTKTPGANATVTLEP